MSKYGVIASDLDKEELRAAVLAVVQTADRYDDEIVAKYGGVTAKDRMEAASRVRRSADPPSARARKLAAQLSRPGRNPAPSAAYSRGPRKVQQPWVMGALPDLTSQAAC